MHRLADHARSAVRHPITHVAGLLLLILVAATLRPDVASAVACSSSAPAQNDITVVPSHGSVFYIDTGVDPVLDAGYIGYQVTNGTGSPQDDLWAEVSDFSGGIVTLNNAGDSMFKLPELADTETSTSYFMLKATGATTSAQTHVLKVYDHRPDLSNATLLYECDFSFAKVQETIKAAANKVNDNGLSTADAIEVTDTSPELGQTITISVEGQTGQIGQGSTPDYDIIWLTPAAVSSWPSSALRLESVSITFDGNGNWATTGDQVTYADQLLITDADGLTNVDSSEYRVYYTFRVVGQPTSTVTVVPVAQIASGTQVKHSDIGAAGGTLDLVFSALTVNATLTKSVTATTGLDVEDCTVPCAVPGAASTLYVAVPFRLTAESTTATDLTIDEFIDEIDPDVIFKPGSATITDIGRVAVAVDDPVTLASETAADPRPYHFIGPFMFDSGTDAVLDYEMWVPMGTFVNVAFGLIGDILIGATATAMQQCEVVSDGSGSVSVLCTTVNFAVVATTNPATDVTSSAATLNGGVDPNGENPATGKFEYGASPTLSGATTVTATTPASGTLNGLTDPTLVEVSISGLSSGTTYYFRVLAEIEGPTAYGEILSFVTQAVLADPTPTTTAATSVTTTTATLNGTINPNLTPITGIQFIYGTVSDLSSGTTTKTVDDGSGTAALTAGGSSAQPFSYDITGLTPGATYYFKIRACTSALTGSYPDHSCSTFFDGSILSFEALDPPTVTTEAATAVNPTDATLNGTVNANGSPTTTQFIYGTVSDLSSGTTIVGSDGVSGSSDTPISETITGLSPNTTYYFRAVATNGGGTVEGDILSFTTGSAGALPRTLTIDESSYDPAYDLDDAPPTITSTPSAGSGTKTYSSSTPAVCTVNETTGAVTFVGVGTCTIGAAIATDGTYADATAETISFVITSSPSNSSPTPSTTSSLLINSGASCTPSADVTITLQATGAVDVLIGNDAAFVGSSWETFQGPTMTKAWTLPSGDGTHTVYAMFRDATMQQFGAVSDPIILDFDDSCGTPPSLPPTAPPPTSPETPAPTTPPPPAVPTSCTVECSSLTYDLYIVNPDGSERHTGTRWVAVQTSSDGAVVYGFEDKGTDFDYNDVIITANTQTQSCSGLRFEIRSLSAGWHHQVRLKVSVDGMPKRDYLIARDTHFSLGSTFTLDMTADPALCKENLSCLVDCADIDFDPYIVNPDGTERHTGTEFATMERREDGTFRVGFEDSGTDFDHDDIILELDRRSCEDVRVRSVVTNASWHHAIRMRILKDGKKLADRLLWNDSHASVGTTVFLNLPDDPEFCRELYPAAAGSAVEESGQPTGAASAAECILGARIVPRLAVGSSGGMVVALQEYLRCLDLFPADATTTGYFGAITRGAVIAFQTLRGIDPLGFVGPLTAAALNAALAP